jgi:signal transduction histidine kinase
MLTPWKRFIAAVGFTIPAARSDDRLDRRSVELLARAAHEGRQPLSAARAALELIRHSSDIARRERACVVIDRQLVRLARLFDDLLETTRHRLGRLRLRVEQIDFCRLVAEAMEAIEPQVSEKHQQFTTSLPEQPLWMDGDAARLQQVVSNLVVNAIKYTSPNGRVSVALAHGRGAAVLTVSDTGRGINAEVLPHIFEPFIRGDNAPGEGLGIGLAIARQLVELHGGTIRASSPGLGRGSEFVVTLPARASRHDGAEREEAMTAPLSQSQFKEDRHGRALGSDRRAR